jgi:hypothetical protein
MAIPVSGVNRWLTLNDEQLLFDAGCENINAGAREYQHNHFRITEEAPDDLEIRVEGEPILTERYGRWIWYPEAFAGLYSVDVSAPGHGDYHTQIRVLPGNITLRQQEQMLEDISNISVDLLFQLQSPAREQTGTALADQYQSPLRNYRLVKNLMGDLEKAMALIARTPHRALVGRQERRQWHEPAVIGANATAVPGPVVAVPNARPGIPAVWPFGWQVERSELTYDIYENRLLKHFLWSQLLPRLIQIEDGADEEIQRRRQKLVIYEKYRWKDNAAEQVDRIAKLEEVIDTVRSLQQTVIRWGNLPFLRWVRPSPLRAMPTQVLQKDPGYNQFYTVYLRFQHELRRGVTAERLLTQMALRKMAELYEMWAVFRITDVLLPLLRKIGYQVVSETGFFRLEDQLFHFEVDRNAVIKLTRGKTRVLIRYEPLYPHLKKGVYGLVTTRYPWLTPDLAVERWEDGIPQSILIFDPKYKSEEREGQMTYWERDLDKMSTYYSEILWKSPDKDSRPEQVVASAYILYPGEVLVHNEDYPRVGALPVVPEREQRQDVHPVLVDLLRNGGLMGGGDK